MKPHWRILLLLACTAAPQLTQAQSLFEAARSNDLAQAKRLLDANADVNQQDEKGYTPLILATYSDSFEVANYLLEHGARTDLTDRSGRTALMGASFKGNEREVKLLLDHGANASAADSKGFTSMMYAVMFAHLSVIQDLRSHQDAHAAVAHVSPQR